MPTIGSIGVGRSLVTVAVAIALSVISVVHGDTIRVPEHFPTIQGAIQAAAPSGDVVMVAPGKYPGPVDFLGKAIVVRAVTTATTLPDPMDPTQAAILDGHGARVVWCRRGEGPLTVLEGFTITGGGGDGGGMLIESSSPRIVRCAFINNRACVAGESCFGGAIAIDDGRPIIEDSLFRGNTAEVGGGAIHVFSGQPVIRGCVFEANRVIGGSGGAVATSSADPVVIERCVFEGNVAEDGQAGAVLIDNGRITSSLFVKNHGNRGSALIVTGDVAVVGCTVADNASKLANGGAMCFFTDTSTVANSIVWGNAGGNIGTYSEVAPVMRYCVVEGGYSGECVLDCDPIFVDPAAGNYRLAGSSPCIDGGDTDVALCGGAIDLDGRARFVTDPCSTGTGLPDRRTPHVDLGPYEFVPWCPLDVNCDKMIDDADVLAILMCWGDCPGCAEDVDRDGFVSFEELLAVLEAWGPCTGS